MKFVVFKGGRHPELVVFDGLRLNIKLTIIRPIYHRYDGIITFI